MTSGVTAACAAESHSCAIRDGALYCWGRQKNGRLGNDETDDVTVATPPTLPAVGLASGVTHVACQHRFFCAVVNGEARCAGEGNNFVLGTGSDDNEAIAETVVGLTSGVTAIVTGLNYACAVKDGVVYCWGKNDKGQTGTTPSGDVKESATAVSGSGVLLIDARDDHTCWWDSMATLTCTGSNHYFKAGAPPPSDKNAVSAPHAVADAPAQVDMIATGERFSCVLSAYSVSCMGDPGHAGVDSNMTAMAGLEDDVEYISGDGTFLCGIFSNGTYWCLGNSLNGQLGYGGAKDAPYIYSGVALCVAPPTAAPTASPTAAPTAAPTASPTASPTAAPTPAPTAAPTGAPSASPTAAPTAAPSAAPTAFPTAAPTAAPSAAPTAFPTAAPSTAPTAAPTMAPTVAPTAAPTTVHTMVTLPPSVTTTAAGDLITTTASSATTTGSGATSTTRTTTEGSTAPATSTTDPAPVLPPNSTIVTPAPFLPPTPTSTTTTVGPTTTTTTTSANGPTPTPAPIADAVKMTTMPVTSSADMLSAPAEEDGPSFGLFAAVAAAALVACCAVFGACFYVRRDRRRVRKAMAAQVRSLQSSGGGGHQVGMRSKPTSRSGSRRNLSRKGSFSSAHRGRQKAPNPPARPAPLLESGTVEPRRPSAPRSPRAQQGEYGALPTMRGGGGSSNGDKTVSKSSGDDTRYTPMPEEDHYGSSVRMLKHSEGAYGELSLTRRQQPTYEAIYPRSGVGNEYEEIDEGKAAVYADVTLPKRQPTPKYNLVGITLKGDEEERSKPTYALTGLQSQRESIHDEPTEVAVEEGRDVSTSSRDYVDLDRVRRSARVDSSSEHYQDVGAVRRSLQLGGDYRDTSGAMRDRVDEPIDEEGVYKTLDVIPASPPYHDVGDVVKPTAEDDEQHYSTMTELLSAKPAASE